VCGSVIVQLYYICHSDQSDKRTKNKLISSLASVKSIMVYLSGASLPTLSWNKGLKRVYVCVCACVRACVCYIVLYVARDSEVMKLAHELWFLYAWDLGDI